MAPLRAYPSPPPLHSRQLPLQAPYLLNHLGYEFLEAKEQGKEARSDGFLFSARLQPTHPGQGLPWRASHVRPAGG